MVNRKKRNIVGIMCLGLLVLISPLTAAAQDAGREQSAPGKVERQVLSLDPQTTIRKTPLAVNEVEPARMYSAFVTQYELGPDVRWFMALEKLIFINMRWNQLAAPSYSLGRVVFDDRTVSVALLQEGRVIVNLEMPTYADFPTGMAMLQKAAGAMGWQMTGVNTETRGDALEARLITWRDRFYSMDVRGIIRALVNLEEVRGSSAAAATNPKLWATVSMGYTMLGLSFDPDVMDHSESCYEYGLAALALSRHLDPRLPTVREEAFLAFSLGYKEHARIIMEKSPVAEEHFSAVIASYLRGDTAGLKALQEKRPEPLGYTLLGRLYRQAGMWEEARELAGKFVAAEPQSYASMIAAVNEGDLSLGHKLTVIYPLDILAQLQRNVLGWSGDDERRTWAERANAVSGQSMEGDISFQQFDDLLDKWTPFGDTVKEGLIIDFPRIRDAYRALYSDALYSRFYFLLHRWAVSEMAATFVKSLGKTEMNHPLVLYMRLQVANDMGDRASQDRLCVRVIQHPQTTSTMAYWALHWLSNRLDKFKYAAQAFTKLTARTGDLSLAGLIFMNVYNMDMAERALGMYLERDPFDTKGIQQLVQVRGDSSVMDDYAKRFPSSFQILKTVAKYFAARSDQASWEKAVHYYEQARALAPSGRSLVADEAAVLRELKRYDEAVGLLKDWLDKYGAEDMSTLSYKQILAVVYLRMGQPQAAVDLLAPVVGSYKANVMLTAAWAYDALHQDAQAEDLFRKVMERYPASDGVLAPRLEYLLRHQRDREAAELIAEARPRHGQYDYFWYFPSVRKELKQAGRERLLALVSSLAATGASVSELYALTMQCFGTDKELSYAMLDKIPSRNPMELMLKNAWLYTVFKDIKGEAEANRLVDQTVPPEYLGMMSALWYRDGLYELMLYKLQKPFGSPSEQDFFWLEKVLAWLALGRNPSQMGTVFEEHYKLPSPGYYHTVGQFLLGKVPLPVLLDTMATAKQRCEFAYYIGFASRLSGQYAQATNWYQICLETLLYNNGEFYWAMEEMSWWAQSGTLHRQKLMREDKDAYWKEKFAETR